MARKTLILCILVAYADLLVAADAYGDRPRGVPAEKAALYEEKDEFQCLDGAARIPFDRVNDDYCDCADGSDEPGTSACANGRFYCHNHGYRAITVPASRVNDGVCDCCDGSDEWAAEAEGGAPTCADTCGELGVAARRAHAEHKTAVESGYRRRQELAREGARAMDERRAELEKRRREHEDLQPLRSASETQVADAEKLETEAKGTEDTAWNAFLDSKRVEEAKELFSKVDLDHDGEITIEDLKLAVKTVADRVLEEADIQRIFGEETRMTAEKFREKLLDVRHYFRKLVAKVTSTSTTTPAPSDDELAHEANDDDDSIEPIDAPDEDATAPTPDEADEDAYAYERKPDYGEDTRTLIDEATRLRDIHQDTQNKINDLERQIREDETFLQSEYGLDAAWAPLKGQCIELNQAQYTYRLCLFDRTVQKDRHGHHEVSLGNWKEWERAEGDASAVDYKVQRYTDGQHCWNGPARSTRVYVECGDELALIEAKEPAKCEYEFRMRAPAACPDPATLVDPYAVHVEL